MGYSYGAWVTSQYAFRHPDRLARVVLIAPAGTVLPITGEFITRMVLSLLPGRYFVKSVMYWAWDDLVRMGPVGRAIADERVVFVRLAYRSFKFKAGVNPVVLSDAELRSISAPTLYIAGEHEKAHDPREAIKRLNAVAPRIETELIPGTGHDLMFTHAGSVNRRILEFLR
jgi:pimeloyl-ACP methyl ester carboxylesterase